MFGWWFCAAVAIPATVSLLCVAVSIPATVFPLLLLKDPAGLRGKYRQAVAARNGEWSTGSSTSSGGRQEDQKFGRRRKEKESMEGNDFHPGEKVVGGGVGYGNGSRG